MTSDGSPNMPEWLDSLGTCYSDRFERLGDLEDFERAIEHFSRALTLTPDGHPDIPDRLGCLGSCYGYRFQRLGELEDLEKSIDYNRRALASTPDSHPNLPHWLYNLGAVYSNRFERLGNREDLEKSIEYFSRALAAIPPEGHPSLPALLNALGKSYGVQFEHLGDLKSLENSIEHLSRALAFTPDEHLDISYQLANLGMAYRVRFERLGDIEDLDKSIEHLFRALSYTPDGHPEIADRLDILGTCYGIRSRRLDDLEDLEKWIDYSSRALALTPDGHTDISSPLASLGDAYLSRFQRAGDLKDLEISIEHLSHALKSTPSEHPDISHQLQSLGTCYDDRFQRLGNLEDLERSTEYYSRALASIPDGHPGVSHRLAALGGAYLSRFEHLGELEDFERSAEHYSRALALTPDGHPDISGLIGRLGACYSYRFHRLGELEDLEKSIEYRSRALTSTSDGHPDISRRLAELGESCSDRFKRLGDLEDLEKSIEYNSRAVALTPDGHLYLPARHFGYAIARLFQYDNTNDTSHLHTSLHSLRTASHSLNGAPRDRFRVALQWTKLASQYPHLNLLEAYQATINLLPQFVWLGATAYQRYDDLSTTENLAVNAACAAISSSNYSLALEWLEHARCVVWNQSLMLLSPLDRLRSCHPDLATQLETIASQLHSSTFETQSLRVHPAHSITPEQAGQQRLRLANEYHDLLAQARQLPGFEDFLQPVRVNKLIRTARNGPIVVINCHTDRCDALFILPGHDEIKHLHLPNFTEEKAQQARSDLEKSLRNMKLRERGVKVLGQIPYKDRIGSVLATLWIDVVKPVLDYLGYLDDAPRDCLPHITWCLTSTLSFLPLHAAGDYAQPRSRVFDYVISSYTPTATALLASTPSSLGSDCQLLVVGQATTPGHNPLPGTTQEIAHIKAHAQNKVQYSELIDDRATTTSVLDAMEYHSWVHLACHAHQNVNDPTKSGFYLHDGTLDLASLNRRSFKGKGLAFLSACQTATGDDTLPDEAIHLASGMLMAGYPSVIATMWSVVDEDAPLVADEVYARLMTDGKVGNGEAGKALHEAVAALRAKVGEKEFGRWVPYIHMGS